MIKRLLGLAVLIMFILFCSFSYAQISNEEFSSQMQAMKEKLAQVKNEYIQAKKETRKAAMDSFLSFGKTEEEKTARKQVLQEAKEKQEQLRQAYLKAKEGFRVREREMKAMRKEAGKAMGEAKMKREETQQHMQKELKRGLGRSRGRGR